MPTFRFTSPHPLVFPDLPDGCRTLQPGETVDLPDGHPYTTHPWLTPEPAAPKSKPANTAAEEH